MINTLLKRRMENTKKNKKGFTLVELIVVLVIIAILAAVLIPTMSGYISRARKTAAQSNAKTQVTAYAGAATGILGTAGQTYFAGTTDVTVSAGDTATVEAVKLGGSDIVTTGNGVYSVKYTADGAVKELTYKEGKYTVTFNGSTYAVS